MADFMRSGVGLFVGAWYIVGLAAMFKAGYVFWMIVGMFIPILPMFYLAYRFLVHFMPWL